MRLFKRNKRGRKALPTAHWKESLWVSISSRIDYLFDRVAAYLNRKTCYWNRTAKLMALALFCLLFGSICLLLLCKALIY